MHFRQLKVWRKARALLRSVYRVTNDFPRSEQNNFTSQMRRSSASIVSNICESTGKWGVREQIRILQISMGSTRELHGQIISAGDVGLIQQPTLGKAMEAVREVEAMLGAFIESKRRILASRDAHQAKGKRQGTKATKTATKKRSDKE